VSRLEILESPAAAVRPTATTPDAPAMLRVQGLSVSYGDAGGALADVSFDVRPGSVVAVLGNNGAGKSTLLRAICGTLPYDGGRVEAGSIAFGGRRLDGLGPADIVRAGVGQVPEGRRVFADLTVEENLRAGGLTLPGRAQRRRALDEVIELFERLRERRDQKAGLLSGGEQQMLAIGRALMAGPQLLLLDEPSLGLAPQLVDQIGEVVREINARGTSVLLVEQNAAMALRIADRALVLEVGRVTLEGDAAALAASDEVRRRYLGVGEPAAPPPEPGAHRVAALPPRRSKPLALRARDLTVRFGGLTALCDVSLDIEPGSMHAVIGPNGAGKSTCLNVLTGVYRAAAGTVAYGDRRLETLRRHEIARLGISRTFQNIALSPEATVADNLLLGRHRLTRAGFVSTGLALPSARRERERQLARVREVAELLGLAGQLDRRVHALSYGDRKRVELARAVCAEPDLLLLDEPVAGMNGAESEAMAATIAALRERDGLSIVLVEHDMTFVMALADRVTVLDFGRRIACGTPAEVQHDPEVVRAYLGASGEGKAA
jgi:ABC-type branched-subunit amino acid transport system ATPase component